ncbi:FK506-binding [Seminavis robusta]|uniref:peptidylprolyl isomerase n=1 Tax=Seminavis robusta TaxID=568900 RepID=A0A9N8DAY6_9STRA|nr:FK506-binding [Seminavis robusta]|eukprot:Sro19_g013520.1 FK506-binding (242) ;mRNA; r:101884-102609
MPRTSKTAAGRRAFISNNTYINTNNTTVVSTESSTTPTDDTIKSSSSSSKQPKSVLDKIVYAIRQQPGTSKGVSRTAIAKYLKAEMEYENPNAIKTALKKGVDKGVLEQNGQSFRVSGDPVVEVDEGPPLEIIDVGSNADQNDEDNGESMTAQIGDSVTMKYVGKLDDGYCFDRGSLTFTLGAGDVIKGWDQGVPGMKLRSKRKLIVPSRLGYGKRGCAPDIPGNATLHFQVTLTDINRPN